MRKVFHDNADRLVLSCPACYGKVNEAMIDHDKKIAIVDIMELFSEFVERERK